MLITCPFCISTNITEVTTIGAKRKRFLCNTCHEYFHDSEADLSDDDPNARYKRETTTAPVIPNVNVPVQGDAYQQARGLLSHAHVLLSGITSRDDEHRALLAAAQTQMARAADTIRAMEEEYPTIVVPF